MNYALILRFSAVIAVFALLSIAVSAGDVTVGIGDIYSEKNNELFLSLKNTEANGHDYRLVSAGSAGGIGVGKFAVYDATAGKTRMVIDSAGKVGIGTTDTSSTSSNSYNLKVQGANGATGLYGHGIEFTRGGANYIEAVTAGGDLYIGAGTGYAYVKRDTGVGIGTASPGSLFQVGDGTTANANAKITLGKTETVTESTLPTIYSENSFSGGNDIVLATGSSSGGLVVATGNPLVYNRLIVTAAGSVGIGTTTPAAGYKLDVSGKIHATDDICTDVGGKCLSTASGGSVAWNSITSKPAGFNDDVDNVGISSETDPKVGTLTADKWCKAKTKSDGITLEIECSQNAPITSEFDPEVDTIIDGKWCKGYLGAVRCDYLAPADSDWTISGNDMYSGVSGSVGIGMAPGTKFDVLGNARVATSSGTGILRLERALSTGTNNGLGEISFGQTNGATKYQDLAKIQSNSVGANDAADIRFLTKAAGKTISESMRIDSAGNVGIGTASTSPKTKLDVAGEVKFGNTGLTCNSDAAGAVRYNSGSKIMEFCDGSAWKAIDQNTGSTGGGGTTPTTTATTTTTTTTTIPTGSQVWSGCSSGGFNTNVNWDYTMGYKFSPTQNGQISKLCGYFSGTKPVKLYSSTYAVLASASVTGSNSWSCTAITPVAVASGLDYYVVAYLGGSGAAYQYLPSSLPRTCGAVNVKTSVYQSGNIFNSAHSDYGGTMYGATDIFFG